MKRPLRAGFRGLVVVLLWITIGVLIDQQRRHQGDLREVADQLRSAAQESTEAIELARQARAGQATIEAAQHATGEARDRALEALFASQLEASRLALETGRVADFLRLLESTDPARRDFVWRHLALRRDLLRATYAAYNDYPTALAFDPSGRWLAVGEADGTLQILDLEGGSVHDVFEGEGDAVVALAVQTAGPRVAAGTETGRVYLLTAEEPAAESLPTPGKEPITALAFLEPDQLLVAAEDETVTWWDLQTVTSQSLDGHPGWVLSLDTSLDPPRVAGGSSEGTVCVWSLPDLQTPQLLHGHEDWVLSVAFSADGETLASGADDHTARLWSLADAEEIGVLEFERSVFVVEALRGERDFLVVDQGGRALRWGGGSGSGSKLTLPLLSGEALTALAVDPALDAMAFVTSEAAVHVWNRRASQATLVAELADPIARLAVSERWIAVAAESGALQLLDAHSGVVQASLSPGAVPITALALADLEANAAEASAATHLLAGLRDGTVQVLEVPGGEVLCTWQAHAEPVGALALTAAQQVLSVARSGAFQLYDCSAQQVVTSKRGPAGGAFSVATASDGSLALWAADGGTLRLWDAVSGDRSVGLRKPEVSMVSALALSTDQTRLATISLSTYAFVWSLPDGELRARFHDRIDDRIEAIALAPSGRRLATGSFRGVVRLWDSEGGHLLGEWGAHRRQPIDQLVFDPRGDRLLATQGRSLTIWETNRRAYLEWEGPDTP